jgi:hypothetical protein
MAAMVLRTARSPPPIRLAGACRRVDETGRSTPPPDATAAVQENVDYEHTDHGSRTGSKSLVAGNNKNVVSYLINSSQGQQVPKQSSLLHGHR